MNLYAIIEEINKLESPSKHKSALDIFRLLENNKALFKDKLDQTDFSGLVDGFERLAYASQAEYTTSAYQADYDRMKALLLYHLNKIL